MKKVNKLLNIAISSAIAVSALQGADIKGSGASFPYSVYTAWTKAYYKATKIEVDYISKGSSKGIKDAKNRAVDFAGTDKPLSPKTLKKHKLYQFPGVVGAITLGYNIPNVSNLRLSRAAIAEIALGNIKYWDNELIQNANPKIKLPHKKLTFVHRSDGSGTTYNFTYYLSKSNSQWKHKFGAKKSLNWPGDHHIGGNKNTGVASLIKQTPYSVGYIDYADAASNHISMAIIENKEGYFVKPNLNTFQEAASKAKLNPKRDFYAVIADPSGKNSYPIVAATFVLLPKEKTATNKKVTAFYSWAYQNGAKIAKELGFVPLPQNLINKINKYWKSKGIK